MKNYCPNNRFACFSRLRRGYSLIELLVVVSLIGILTSIGIASYNNFNQKKRVMSAANELKTYIRLTASKARNNEKDCNVCSGADSVCATGDDLTLDGWYINFPEKKIYGHCGGLSGGQDFGDTYFFIPDGIVIDSSGTDEILFDPLTGETDLSGSLIITASKDDNEFSVIIDPSGNVSN